ncbi:unnamed protein product [Litomosoides sigmodontis]|uniref:Zinc finger protein 593 homolog n=1 Tax=Litomosoides sigmodontis TaxID=42156 RepID=A0A3P6TEE2_LITSI|nr:unnamed protein product [Litomosoides sigmodontis]
MATSSLHLKQGKREQLLPCTDRLLGRTTEGVYNMPKKHTTSNKTRKRKGKDIDQIIEGIRSAKQRCSITQSIDFNLELPGDGQFYCIECARYFIDEKSLNSHRSSKVHRRQLKRLREPVYTQHEAEKSVGLKTVTSA